jgi:hypothetical protein
MYALESSMPKIVDMKKIMLSARKSGVWLYGLVPKLVKIPVKTSVTICKTAMVAAVVRKELSIPSISMFLDFDSFITVKASKIQQRE